MDYAQQTIGDLNFIRCSACEMQKTRNICNQHFESKRCAFVFNHRFTSSNDDKSFSPNLNALFFVACLT